MGAFYSSKLTREQYPNFLDPFLGKDLFQERIFPVAVSRISKFFVEWEAPILQFVYIQQQAVKIYVNTPRI